MRPPRLLPDEADGRALFEIASRCRAALLEGRDDDGGVAGLGDIVAVPPVRAARDRGDLHARPMFDRLTATGLAWTNGTTLDCSAMIWCTAFRPALRHLAPLRVRDPHGRIAVEGRRAAAEPRLHLLGYGDWVGPGSATLVGAGLYARDAVDAIAAELGGRRVHRTPR
ncbi:hypothetical protein ACSNOI_30100 [Actinomadura kijaniata]|uniref:hypothetical protein n=1 Tax=Actinomadura kijaniata TaxID=46161 RepID=UPI003F1C8086